jgi:hypothetical protein
MQALRCGLARGANPSVEMNFCFGWKAVNGKGSFAPLRMTIVCLGERSQMQVSPLRIRAGRESFGRDDNFLAGAAAN